MKLKLMVTSLIVSVLLFGCNETTEKVKAIKVTNDEVASIQMTLAQANILADLPLACVQKEYPNKTGHT